MNSHDIYQMVTNTIIELLEDHSLTWNKPWISFGQDSDYARNPTTGRYYRGINQFLLSFSLMQKGYLKNIWMTYAQVKKQNGHIKKGSKSTPVIFYKTAWIDKNKSYYKPEIVKSMSVQEMASRGIQDIPVLKLYRVFNVAQTEGLDEAYYDVEPSEPLSEFQKDTRAEKLIQSTGAKIEIEQSNRAFYNLKTDTIHLPLREQFKGQAEPFYATALHELAHWTGHETRLNRTFGSFGSTEYAKEELVAELTSAFCCADLGFSKTINNSAGYIKEWLGILKSDSKAIVKAASHAQKAADYITGGPEFAAYQKDY